MGSKDRIEADGEMVVHENGRRKTDAIKTRYWLVIGLAIREAFSYWTGHPFDFELWVRTGYWVARGVSPYGVVPVAPGLSFASIYSAGSESTIGYLPFWPILLDVLYRLYAFIGIDNRFLYYFILKQPMIIADVLLAYYILRYVRLVKPSARNSVLAFWLLSPYTVIISSIWGMFDCVAMLAVVLALNARVQNVRSVMAGLAIWIKSIPLIYAIPLAYSSGKDDLRNLALAIAIPVLTSLAVIAIMRWPLLTAFTTLNSTVGKGGQSLSGLGFVFYLNQLGLIGNLSSLQIKVLGDLWLPALLLAAWLGERWYGFTTDKGLVQSLLLCTVTFLLFKAQVNEQYATYILALALIDIVLWNPRRKWLYFALTATVMVFLLINNVYLVRFLAPSDPNWATMENAIIRSQGELRFSSLFASSLVFVALNLVYLALLVRNRRVSPTSRE